ncbi:hypothetical protein LTR96_011044 [Exophiala xenobiotica]|nr:hypothetical protein LTR41_011139 [Exophiala xenobiotica]KAK5220797.1 hypothetical protein LTR47_011146 [Exophiala xenobiotica]KAK5245249.1 hypothetical protein LTS06_009301 [Exophiala xenobiotica]KAK5263563.1 hypothetical protein LTR96_011044 [Exophiala xenobiotica]KAK5332688.1 hypothetical protein LTR98_011187 [Exophiala xenobiotica]
MSASLERLPFDIIHNVASQLDASLRQTLGRINDCQAALQEASPYSACIIAYASSFAYHSSLLCYVTRGNLRILNFNDQRGTEKIFEGNVLVNHLAVSGPERGVLDLDSFQSLQILGIADDITVVHCDFGAFGQYVFAIDISDSRPPSSPAAGLHPRVRLCARVRSSNKLFTRHNRHFLVMGSHSATGSQGHNEWLLQVFSLGTGELVNAEPLQLQGFCGSEIGTTACFTIHDSHFYAVANQTSLENEEVDWTSYYQVVKFRLDDPCAELPIKVIWRRQHLEGPINDAWTDLGFQVDECTGELLIVECRKEWVNGGSRSIRTCYAQPVDRAKIKDQKDGLRHPPTGDRLIRTLDENSNSRYEEPHVRIERYVHVEFPAVNEENVKEYIRAKTKWNGYSVNAQCFADLVTDDFVPEGEWRHRQRIRLRVVSRQELCPLIRDERAICPTALIVRPRIGDQEDQEMEDGERTFSPSHVYLWPPDNAPQELQDILCLEGRVGDVKAILGDEGIIYMAGLAIPDTSERALVFICLDPTFGFTGMKRLDGNVALPKRERKRKSGATANVRPVETNEDQFSRPMEAERVKRPKLESGADNHVDADTSSSVSAYKKPEPDRAVPAQGDDTAQALGLDPLTGPPTSSQPTSPATSAFRNQQERGKEPGRSSPLPTTRTTWREHAAYMSIGKGYWLR